MRVIAPLPITALACCTGLGDGIGALGEALLTGRTALGPATLALPFVTAVGEVQTPLASLPPALSRWDTRLARLVAHLLHALEPELTRARQRWGDARIGVLLGTSNAGVLSTEAAHAQLRADGKLPPDFDFVRQHAYDGILQVTSDLAGLRGPACVVSTACSSGAKVLASAQRWIAAGVVDAVLVGGVDTLCQTTLRGFHSLGALSSAPCRPFSADRDGISIGEGGALLLVERSGAPLVRLLAVGESSDAHHLSAPHPEGEGAEAAMRHALSLSGLLPGQIDHVNAHGTATPLNDIAEGLALHRLLGSEIPVTSTKSYTGHLLGAAGAVEAVISALCLQEGLVPANLGLLPQDPAIELHLPGSVQRRPLQHVLCNSFAFGGNNTALLLGAP